MPPQTQLLPKIETLDAYRPIYRSVSTWLPAMQAICRRHALDPRSLEFAPPGSNVVFWAADDRLIKLFPPFWAADCEREKRVLAVLAANAAYDFPRVHFSGELEGWPYLVLSRLPGVSLDAIWDELDPPGRERIAAGLGSLMKALHATPTAGLRGLEPEWAVFIQEQRAGCLERQRAAGASPAWLADIAAFYAHLPPLVEPGYQPVLINADLNPEHIFCRQSAAGWEVSGVIDFGDAMLAHPDYEFVAPGFIFAAQPAALRAMLLAYGLPRSALDPALARRLTAQILLHRFIDVTQLPALYPHHPPQTMRELVEVAWPIL